MDARTGDRYLFLAVDHFTKLAWAEPIREKTKQTLEGAILKLLAQFGVPEAVLSDNGREFRNDLVERLLRDNHVEERHGLPYHSTTNGGVERANKTVSHMVLCLL